MPDIISLGEMVVDFTAAVTPDGETAYIRNAGGAPANVACMAAKLGASVGFIGKLGKDMFGDYLKGVLTENNVDTKGLIIDPKFSTTLTFVRKNDDGDRDFVFFRSPDVSADINLSFGEINKGLIDECKIFHFGAVSLTNEPSRSAALNAAEYAKEKGKIVSYDPNFRPALWKSKEEAIRTMRMALRYADIVRVSENELNLISDCGSFIPAAAELLRAGVKVLCVTQGAKGCIIATAKGIERYPSYKTKIIDTLGAGDCFLGAFLYKLCKSGKTPDELEAEDIMEMAMFSNACGALSSAKKGAIQSMPALNEILELMKTKPVDIDKQS